MRRGRHREPPYPVRAADDPSVSDGGATLAGTAGEPVPALGPDVVDAQDPGSRGDAGKDDISCGPGRDEVLMDAGDGERPEVCEMAGVGQS